MDAAVVGSEERAGSDYGGFCVCTVAGRSQGHIEEITTRWDKTVVDRRNDLLHWVEMFRELRRRNLQVYAYANNHYAKNGPGTVKLFWEMYEGGKSD